MTNTALKNPSAFFDEIRARLFKDGLKQGQVDGINAILAYNAVKPHDPRDLSYMLATPYWETGKTMQAVRETHADTDDEAIRILESSWARGKLPWVRTPYWRKDAQGRSWLGRGLVQLTHESNYKKLSDEIGVDLVSHPEKAMELPVAVEIMFAGMTKGLFTGAKLSDYITSSRTDFVNARRIINGEEKIMVAGRQTTVAAIIATVAMEFQAALKKGNA